MQLRKDAMLGCARMIEGINQLALNHAPLAVSTVGLVEVRPNSRNVIPGSVFFSVDLRHPDSTVLQQMNSELVTVITEIATDLNLEVQCHNNWYSPSVDFDERYINVVRAAVERLRISHCDIISGAGHDAVYVSRVAPTVMVFIPCENGISHNEQEKAEPDHVVAGANVLLNTIISRDKNRLKASDCSD
jgi:N-carbamoyl-L-amino-acid hydrolase